MDTAEKKTLKEICGEVIFGIVIVSLIVLCVLICLLLTAIVVVAIASCGVGGILLAMCVALLSIGIPIWRVVRSIREKERKRKFYGKYYPLPGPPSKRYPDGEEIRYCYGPPR